MREIPLMREFLASYHNPQVRLFRRNILDKTVQDIHTSRIWQAKAGIKGQCDVYGFIKAPIRKALPIEIEFKGPKTRTSPEQERWCQFCSDWGIPYLKLQAQADEEAVITLMRWADELNALVKEICAL